MNECPRCGEDYPRDDHVCPRTTQTAGGSLIGSFGAHTLVRRASCPACSAEDRDDGEGFCAECGHRLVFASGAPSIPPAAFVGRWTVREARAPDDFDARGDRPGEGRAIVVVGAADAIAAEVAALGALDDPRLPRVLEHGQDDRWGTFAALSPPPRGARPLVEAARTLSVEGALDITRQALDIAEGVERARFDWSPMRSDAFLDEGGKLIFVRLRSGRRLAPGERLDARGVTEAVGGALLPEPGTRGTPRLVRLLSAHYIVEADRPCTLESERVELEAVAIELRGRPQVDRSRAALLSDRGMKRAQNEDSASVEMGEGWTVLVTCDGVSSSSHAREASEIASATACATLSHVARTRELTGSAGLQAASTAVRAAHAAVCAHKFDVRPAGEPPGTTIVLSLIRGDRAVIAWVGDSRAYWITRDGGELLTRDHTWLNEAVAGGEWTEADAMLQPLAHALTRCLGPLEWGGAGTVDPDVCVRTLDEPGFLLLCTDGLWNYFPTAVELARVIDPTMGVGEAAERLVNSALAAGAHDNVTVALYRHV